MHIPEDFTEDESGDHEEVPETTVGISLVVDLMDNVAGFAQRDRHGLPDGITVTTKTDDKNDKAVLTLRDNAGGSITANLADNILTFQDAGGLKIISIKGDNEKLQKMYKTMSFVREMIHLLVRTDQAYKTVFWHPDRKIYEIFDKLGEFLENNSERGFYVTVVPPSEDTDNPNYSFCVCYDRNDQELRVIFSINKRNKNVMDDTNDEKFDDVQKELRKNAFRLDDVSYDDRQWVFALVKRIEKAEQLYPELEMISRIIREKFEIW